jgi:enoyl-CoA hydratase/carnithine racemase
LALACHSLERLHDEARSLARELASKAPASLAFAKKTLRQGPLQDIATAMRVEMEAILACMNSEDWHEGLRAFAEKRKPRFTGR